MADDVTGGEFWSDGRVTGPLVFDTPMLVKCPGCATLFWLADAAVAGEFEPGSPEESDFPGIREPETPSEAEFRSYADALDLPAGRKRYIRIRAWWLANDPRRWRGDPPAFDDGQRENLARLSALLSADDPHDRLILAEIARERGMFDVAASLLTYPFPGDIITAADMIRALNAEREPRVVRLGPV